MNIEFNGEEIRTEAEFHKKLASALGVQRYYGCNLDALWDLLSRNVEGPLVIKWHNSNISRNSMGNDFDKIIEVLESVKQQDLSFTSWKDKFDYELD